MKINFLLEKFDKISEICDKNLNEFRHIYPKKLEITSYNFNIDALEILFGLYDPFKLYFSYISVKVKSVDQFLKLYML